jgi:type VI secretion system secreted protein VgrG
MPKTKFDDRFQLIDQHSGEPLSHCKYEIHREFGGVERGVSDVNGFTHFIKNPDSPEAIEIKVLR